MTIFQLMSNPTSYKYEKKTKFFIYLFCKNTREFSESPGSVTRVTQITHSTGILIPNKRCTVFTIFS